MLNKITGRDLLKKTHFIHDKFKSDAMGLTARSAGPELVKKGLHIRPLKNK